MGQVNTLLDNHNHLKSYKNMAIKTSNETGIALHTISEGVYQMISSIGDSGTKHKRFSMLRQSCKGWRIICTGIRGTDQLCYEGV